MSFTPARDRPQVIQGAFVGGRPQLSLLQPRGLPQPAVPRTAQTGPQIFRHDAIQLPPILTLARPGAGRPLPAAVQMRMEAFFRADFSNVRVHVDPGVTALGALAFTRGSDLYFAPGRYEPASPAGQRLLGHELAHVIQQRSGRVRNPFGSGLAVVLDPGLEAEAERLGLRAAAYRPAVVPCPPPPRHAPVPPVLQRMSQPGLYELSTKYTAHRNKNTLLIDPEKDADLKDKICEAQVYINSAQTLGQKLALLVDFVHLKIATNAEGRQQAYQLDPKGSGRTVAKLGELLRDGNVVCREKAAFGELLLANLGIPARIRRGKREGGVRHAWLEVPLGGFSSDEWARVDPTTGKIQQDTERRVYSSRYSDLSAVPPTHFPGHMASEADIREAVGEAIGYLRGMRRKTTNLLRIFAEEELAKYHHICAQLPEL